MLVPSKKQNILDGLEFRVGLGDIWKENLTELSGGQRLVNRGCFFCCCCLFSIAVVDVVGMSHQLYFRTVV